MGLRLDTTARRIDVAARKLLVTGPDGADDVISYDQLVIGTGAIPVRPPIVWPGSCSGPPTGCTCCTRWATPSP